MGVQTILDGGDITEIVQEGSVTKYHNAGPAIARVKVPSDLTGGGDTSRLKVLLDGGLDFHGTVEHIEDQGDEDEMYTVFTAADPWVLWDARPARDPDGDFTKPAFIQTKKFAPKIVEEILRNSQTAGAGPPSDAEGPLFVELGSFAGGGKDLSGAPVDWPKTIDEIVAVLTKTGLLDVVLTPIDSGGNMARVDCYNGDFGDDLSGSVRFEYGTGLNNARKCRRTIDKQWLRNKIWKYGGPRVQTSSDPAGDQHWKFNITGDDPGLDNTNGRQDLIDVVIATSRSNHGVRMEVQIDDADEAIAMRQLWRYLWQMESYLRAQPKTLTHITPDRGIKPAFRCGDLIGVAATSRFRGGFSGAQRVMEYTYRWDVHGVVELGEPVGQTGVPAVVATEITEGLPT